jgi:hypothetical protein
MALVAGAPTQAGNVTSEGGHWYARDGSPRYEVEAANGSGLRKATLRDARKHGWIPGVTSVTKVLAAPGLERWKQNQVLAATVTFPPVKGELPEDYANRIHREAGRVALEARIEGKHIHGAIEATYQDGGVIVPGPYAVHVLGVKDMLYEKCGRQAWSAERPFAHHYGYGSAVDLHSDEWIVDFKNKDLDADAGEVKAWDEQGMQLAAYRVGLNKPHARCANLFVSRTVPGVCRFAEWSPADLDRCWRMFAACLALWREIKRYDPRWSPGDEDEVSL